MLKIKSVHLRQGDLLFVRLSSAARAKPNPLGAGVLALGEATGHSHAIAKLDLTHAEVYLDAEGRLVIEAAEEVHVVHEEHGTVTLEAGTWEVRRQKEYEPDGWRQVAD